MSDIVSILEDFTKAPSEKVPLTPSPYRFAGDNHYWAHVFGQHRHGDFFDFSHVGESNQFEIFLRDRSAQRPTVRFKFGSSSRSVPPQIRSNVATPWRSSS
jgi:hypothetical protein